MLRAYRSVLLDYDFLKAHLQTALDHPPAHKTLCPAHQEKQAQAFGKGRVYHASCQEVDCRACTSASQCFRPTETALGGHMLLHNTASIHEVVTSRSREAQLACKDQAQDPAPHAVGVFHPVNKFELVQHHAPAGQQGLNQQQQHSHAEQQSSSSGQLCPVRMTRLMSWTCSC